MSLSLVGPLGLVFPVGGTLVLPFPVPGRAGRAITCTFSVEKQ